MIVKFAGRPIGEVTAKGYSTEDIEDRFEHPRVEVVTNEEAGDVEFSTVAPGKTLERIDELNEEFSQE